MTRATMTRTMTTGRIRRSTLPLLAATLASAVVLAAPAAAAPEGPDELTTKTPAPGQLATPELERFDPGLTPKPGVLDPTVSLVAGDQCDPEPGIDYMAKIQNDLDRPSHPSVEWTSVGDYAIGVVPGLDGFLSFEDGEYELVASVHYPAYLHKSIPIPALTIESDPVLVTVDCTDPEDPEEPVDSEEPEDPEGPEGPEEPEEPETEVEDEIVEATPTFTG